MEKLRGVTEVATRRQGRVRVRGHMNIGYLCKPRTKRPASPRPWLFSETFAHMYEYVRKRGSRKGKAKSTNRTKWALKFRN